MPRPNTHSFEAIGTHWWFESLEPSRPLDAAVCHALEAYAAEFDGLYSRFIDDSLIGRLNKAGHLDEPPRELLAMLDFSKEMFEVSRGAFNISVGGALHRLGYGDRSAAAAVVPDLWERIKYDETAVTLPPQMTLDTGGYGKGWLIDRFAELLRARGYRYFLINGGGDIYLEASEPIEIALEHPYDASSSVGTTRMSRGALAVSGTAKRAWQHDGRHYHHLIDPMTQTSTDNNVAGVYVQAETALIADTMATTLMIKPELKAELSDRYGLKVIILTNDQLV